MVGMQDVFLVGSAGGEMLCSAVSSREGYDDVQDEENDSRQSSQKCEETMGKE